MKMESLMLQITWQVSISIPDKKVPSVTSKETVFANGEIYFAEISAEKETQQDGRRCQISRDDSRPTR